MDPSGPARVIPTLPIAFVMANFTYMPNFGLLEPSNGPEVTNVVLGHGPGPLRPGEGHPQHAHRLPQGQLHLQSQFQPSRGPPWPRRGTCGTWPWPWPPLPGGFWFGFRLTLTMGTMFRGPLAMGFRFNGNKILNSKYKYNYTIQRFEFPATAATRIRYPSCQFRLYPFFPGSGLPGVVVYIPWFTVIRSLR